MKKRFLLIDSENIQNRLFEIIENSRKKDKIIVFYTVYHSGKLQDYLNSGKDKRNIEFVECIAGNNALDLQLMGVLSYLIQRHPKREFVVYSNDKGYKALVKHWQSKNVDIELINFLTPSVGEDAYEFRSPITVETTKKKSRGRKKRVGFSDVSKELSAPKKRSATAVVEKTVIRKSRPQPETAVDAPETANPPAQPKPAKKAEAEQKPETVQKKEVSAAPSKPRAIVDALLVRSQPENEPAAKPKINNTVPAASKAPEKAPDEEAVRTEVKAEEAPVRKKRGRKSKAEKEAEEAARLAAEAKAETAEEEPASTRSRRSKKTAPVAETETQNAQVQQPEQSENIPQKLSDEDYVREICRSVRSTDLALINRVLSVGFGSEAAKGIYARFKNDQNFRDEMAKLYEYAKDDRIRILIETALARSGLALSAADDICRILREKGTGNMQSVYHSFIKEMPGNVAERQLIYKAVKPYLGIIDNL